MKLATITICAALFAFPALAQSSWTSHDWNSGNSYSNYADTTGVTTYGSNLMSGSNWNVRQNYDGSYSGTDADGNYFTGDHNSGFYSNLGTGVMCTGTGYARMCN